MLENALATATHNQPASPPPDFSVLLGELTDAITQAKAAAVTQVADRGSSSTALQTARSVLFTEHLIPIRNVAIGRLTAVPNVARLFRIPRRVVHRTTLIKEATIISNNAALYKDTFVASGLPADFLDQLNTAITAVAQTGDTRATTRGDQQKATQTLETTLKQGQQLVRGLNGIMQLAFAKNPDVLAAWNSARHIRLVTPVGPVPASTTTSAPSSTANSSPSSSSATATATPVAPLAHAA